MASFVGWRNAMLLVLGTALAGCASNVPQGLAEAPPEAPSRAAVQAAPERHVGQEVRWGGEILSVRNQREATEIEVYGRDLHRDGEPRPDQGDGIRFIARVSGFLDPAQYQAGMRVSVRGRVGPLVTRSVGDYPYRYPQVVAELYHLWPVYEPAPDHGHYYDPFYGPWGPWGYYRHPYWW